MNTGRKSTESTFEHLSFSLSNKCNTSATIMRSLTSCIFLIYWSVYNGSLYPLNHIVQNFVFFYIVNLISINSFDRLLLNGNEKIFNHYTVSSQRKLVDIEVPVARVESFNRYLVLGFNISPNSFLSESEDAPPFPPCVRDPICSV